MIRLPPALPLALLWLLAGIASLHAAPALELVVQAPPELSGLAEGLRRVPAERFAPALRLAGLADPGPPVRVALAPEGSHLAARAPAWASGYALGEIGLVVLLAGRVPSYPHDSLEGVLRHEVAHVLVARAARGGAVPRWFNEGLAMAAAGEWGLGDRTRLEMALLAGGPRSFAAVDALFAGGAGDAHRAYAFSGAAVQDVLRRFGADAPGRALAGVGEGLAFPAAFRRATGVSLAAAEAAFWRRQSPWRRWLPVLTNPTVLWILVTLLALLAIWRRRIRDRELRQRWEALEAGEDGGGTVH